MCTRHKKPFPILPPVGWFCFALFPYRFSFSDSKSTTYLYKFPLSVISIVCNMLYHFFANAHK